MEECKECGGTGMVAYSCCGDRIFNDTELCPSCKEHVGYEEEECECVLIARYIEERKAEESEHRRREEANAYEEYNNHPHY